MPRPLYLIVLAIGAFSCANGARAEANLEPRTTTAVQADDDAWSHAEQSGDAAFVERLLLPDYRSVSADGKSISRVDIIAQTAARSTRQAQAAQAARVAAWTAAHPDKSVITLAGDTAIVVWTSLEVGERVYSCDVFVYRNGHWRALYSQHTAAGG